MNDSLFLALHQLNHQIPWLDQVMVFSAEFLIYISSILVFWFAGRGSLKEKKSLLLILISLALAAIVTKFFRLFFLEERPYLAHQITPLIQVTWPNSFPSVHTTVMWILAFGYGFYRSRFTPLMIGLAVVVSISRIYVGVHYPLDILGGIVLALISVLLSWKLKQWLFKS